MNRHYSPALYNTYMNQKIWTFHDSFTPSSLGYLLRQMGEGQCVTYEQKRKEKTVFFFFLISFLGKREGCLYPSSVPPHSYPLSQLLNRHPTHLLE